jgi:hypothetical protein
MRGALGSFGGRRFEMKRESRYKRNTLYCIIISMLQLDHLTCINY